MVVRLDGAPGAYDCQVPLGPPVKYQTLFTYGVRVPTVPARTLSTLVQVGIIGKEIRFQPAAIVIAGEVSRPASAAVMVNMPLSPLPDRAAGAVAVTLIL